MFIQLFSTDFVGLDNQHTFLSYLLQPMEFCGHLCIYNDCSFSLPYFQAGVLLCLNAVTCFQFGGKFKQVDYDKL